MKIPRGELKKLEELFLDIGYKIRYEKGHFTSGYCLLDNRHVAVINKFFDTEGRFHTLLHLLDLIQPDFNTLTGAQQKLVAKWTSRGRMADGESQNS